MPTCYVFREVHCMVASEFYIVYHLPFSLINPNIEKAKFKVALRRTLNTHSSYSVDSFFMCEDDPKYCI
jgi:hypothetical protein